MTILPDKNDLIISDDFRQKYELLADNMADNMIERFVGRVSESRNQILNDLVSQVDALLQSRLDKVIGNNPFLKSIANTTLNYSRRQLANFWLQQIAKYKL